MPCCTIHKTKAKELEYFIVTATEKYIELYNKHSKGQEKYANLYLAWLNYITSFTCRSQQLLSSLCLLFLLLGGYDSPIQTKTQRTVIACILHSVQDGVQSQMAAKIEAMGEGVETSSLELAGDDTALFRISGWALKSIIDATKKNNPDANSDAQQELALLSSIKRPNTDKNTLPLGVQYLDRGGLTFMNSSLLPWLHEIEASMKFF